MLVTTHYANTCGIITRVVIFLAKFNIKPECLSLFLASLANSHNFHRVTKTVIETSTIRTVW